MQNESLKLKLERQAKELHNAIQDPNYWKMWLGKEERPSEEDECEDNDEMVMNQNL